MNHAKRRVQLDWLEVDAELLDGPGEVLDSVRSRHEIRELVDPSGVLAQMPRGGWRELRPAEIAGGGLDLAAPSGDGWVMLQLRNQGGKWLVAGLPIPTQPIPSKIERASQLTLDWPSETVELSTGTTSAPIAHLTNHGPTPYPHFEVDHLRAVGWVLDPTTEEALAHDPWFGYGSSHQTIASCPPGGTIPIDVHLLTRDMEQLPAGSYKISAMLMSLDLKAPVAGLVLCG